MLSRPRIKHCYSVSVVEPALVFLMTEHTELVFQGEAYVALAPLLDGRHSLTDIFSAAAGKVDMPTLFGALGHLESKGCLAEGEGTGDDAAGAYWDYMGADPARVAQALSPEAVSLQALDGADIGPLEEALRSVGLGVCQAGALQVVAVGDYLSPALPALNRACLESGRPWALVKTLGTLAWLGPVFRPGSTGCWECLAQRLRANRQVEHYLLRRTDLKEPISVAKAGLPSSARFAANWAAAELARSLAAGGPGALEGRILTYDLLRRELQEHPLVKRPQCPTCGTPRRDSAPRPVVLESRVRPVAGFGRERTAPPQETYERYKHLVSPITGVVTALTSREPDQPGGMHTYVAGHYFPVMSEGLSALRVNLIARSGGKGRTAAQARTSALCEALERYSGIAWGDEPRIVKSTAALGADAVPIRELLLFSDRQYASRGAGAASEFHEVPPRLADDVEIGWTPAWSLSQNRARYLPTAYCYYGYRDGGLFFTRCDSNGSAAGNSLEEATLYGFLELLERDSVALWWYNRVRRPAVDAESFGLAYWNEMQRYYDHELHRDLHALDLTADTGIPTFGVVSRRKDRPVEDIIVGFAAHLDPSIALLRALEEANQYVPSVREQNEDGSTLYRLYSEETIRWWRSATFANQPWLVPDAASAPRRKADFENLASDDVKKDVETCVAAAGRAGLEVLVLDQTRPDIGLPVVKVVVPGLRHFWRRLAPGRLYDVPVKLGWLKDPQAEDELNPISCFV